jgi:hypothetical protein
LVTDVGHIYHHGVGPLCITIGGKTKKQAIKKCMFDDLAKSKTAGNKRRYKSRMAAYSDHKVPRFSTGGALVSGGENTKKCLTQNA